VRLGYWIGGRGSVNHQIYWMTEGLLIGRTTTLLDSNSSAIVCEDSFYSCRRLSSEGER
jgi:hypothetical protein